tara:strand:- start:489 stop:1169 length:681 start_codon:yes stop_codon:yes gene_type:complete
LAKRLSEKVKEELIRLFCSGKTLEELSIAFEYTKITISKHLKKNLGETKYKELAIQNNLTKRSIDLNKENIELGNNNDVSKEIFKENELNKNNEDENFDINSYQITTFTEIPPVDYEIENIQQKDLASVPISDICFPKTVYMIVSKNIELETKLLKEYPDWQFLSKDELNRKTIQVFDDLKIAKRFCSNDQRVIKVPNTNVFRIVAPILISRGITRIINSDKLISL